MQRRSQGLSSSRSRWLGAVVISPSYVTGGLVAINPPYVSGGAVSNQVFVRLAKLK